MSPPANLTDIPKKHKAAVYDKPGTLSIKVTEIDTPEPKQGEVLVRLTHSGVCHSDYSVMTNAWKALPVPTQAGQVGGHEGVGYIAKLGPGLDNSPVKVGDRVGIKWMASCCGSCAACLSGYDASCTSGQISGYSKPGTFQQFAIAPASYVTPIPDGLDSAAAAPQLCAGLTVYAALQKADLKTGQFVVIMGAGGGLGHLACAVGAKGLGARVIGIDHGSKKAVAEESGAEFFIDFTQIKDVTAEVMKITGGVGAHAVIVLTSSNAAYAQSLTFLRYGGTAVCVGVPEGEIAPIASAAPALFVFKQLRLVGSAIGNRLQAIETLDLAARGVIKTHFKTVKLEDLAQVFQDMEDGNIQGRVVLEID